MMELLKALLAEDIKEGEAEQRFKLQKLKTAAGEKKRQGELVGRRSGEENLSSKSSSPISCHSLCCHSEMWTCLVSHGQMSQQIQLFM